MSSALILGYQPLSETKNLIQEEGERNTGNARRRAERGTLSKTWGQTEVKERWVSWPPVLSYSV